MYSRTGYWAKMGNHRYLRHNEKGGLVQFGELSISWRHEIPLLTCVCFTELCYQYRCGWDTGVSFVQLVRTAKQTLYFCINFPSCAMTRLEAVVRSNPAMAHRDFFIDALIADDSLKQWQNELEHRRDLLHGHVSTFALHPIYLDSP